MLIMPLDFHIILNKYQYDIINTECLNIHRTHVTANSSTNINVVFFFCFNFKQYNFKQLLILDHNA